MILEPYALRFVENGFAAITYDYRYFGTSGGEPRQLINGIKQQEDLRAVTIMPSNTRKSIAPGSSCGAFPPPEHTG